MKLRCLAVLCAAVALALGTGKTAALPGEGIYAGVALALIAIGIAARRSSAHRRPRTSRPARMKGRLHPYPVFKDVRLSVANDRSTSDKETTIMRPHRLVALLAVLALAVFTGAAVAGDGHGNGGGNGNSDQHSQQSQPAAAPASQPAAPASDSKHESKQSSTSASQPATGGDNSHGVKPSNSTKHDTYAKASSDQTKQYGNGRTAGQIATKAGYGDATLHGPGNSQPHKTAPCPGGHEVDVHALKHKGSKCGTSSPESKQVESKKVDVEKSKKSDVESKKHEQQKVEVQKTASHGVAESAHAHVTICHATGSSSNPYVRISPSASGVFHGHLGHQDGRDIVPPFTWKGQTYSENWTTVGMAIYNAGCSAPAQAQVQVAATQSGSTVTATPSATSPTPSTIPTQAVGAVAPASISAAAVPASAPAPAAAAPAAAGGVKGAVVALKPTKTKPAGSVLGTTTRLGGTVGSTRLPFTGLPLWIFALVAAGLIGVGLAMRQASTNRS